MKIKIEKGIPYPTPMEDLLTPKSDPYIRYHFHKLEVGDSFRFEANFSRYVSQAACHYGRRHSPVKFSVRRISHKHCRLWRIR